MQVNQSSTLNATHSAVVANGYTQSEYRSAWDILRDNQSTLIEIASQYGINWQAVLQQAHHLPCTLKNGIQSEPKYRGKVICYINSYTDKNGREYPSVTFNSFKHGGLKETWNGYQAEHPEASYTPRPSKRPAQKHNPSKADQRKDQQSINRFNQVSAQFQTLHKATESLYLTSKGFQLSDIPESLDLRQGDDKRGHYIIYPIHDHHGNRVGFQQIYDNLFQDYPHSVPRNKDFIFLPQKKNGSYALLGEAKGKNIDIAEGLASGLSAYLASGIPCAIALDANGLSHVANHFRKLRVRILADNDVTSNKGNVGLYAALKIANSQKVKVVYPILSGQKCDFNDVWLAEGRGQVKKQLRTHKIFTTLTPAEFHYAAVEYIPQPQLKKTLSNACFYVAHNISTIKEYRYHCSRLIRALRGRGVKKGYVQKTVKRMFSRYVLKQLKQKHSITDFSGTEVKDTTQMTNEQIADYILSSKNKLFIDIRGMGLGKTELMRLVAKIFKQRQQDNKVVYTAPRVSLALVGSKRLDLDFYKDQEAWGGKPSQHLSVCVNSTPHHHITDTNLFMMDEARQTLEFVSTGTVDNRDQVQETLIKAINNSDTTMLADADFNNFTLEWLKTHSDKQIEILIDRTPARHNKNITVLKNMDALLVEMMERLDTDENVWVTTDSKNQLNKTVTAIELLDSVLEQTDLKPADILTITADNKKDPRQAKLLANPNEESKKYRLIISTPVISSGVSITNDHFDVIYGMFSNVITANEMLQAIGRIRAVQDIRVAFNRFNYKQHQTEIESLIEGEVLKDSRHLGGRVYEISTMAHQKATVQAGINESLNHYDREFLLLAQLKGYTVNSLMREEKIVDLAKRATEKDIQRVMKARTLNNKQHQKLKRIKPETQSESDSYERAEVKEMTGKTYEDLTIEDVQFYKNRGTQSIKNFELIHSSIESVKENERKQHAQQGESDGSTSRKLFMEEILDDVLDIELKADSDEVTQLLTFLQSHHAELNANHLGCFRQVERPMSKLKHLLDKMGYQLIESRRTTHQRYYKVEINPQVLTYVTNRGLITVS